MQARDFYFFSLFWVFCAKNSKILVKFTLENKIFEFFLNFCVKKRDSECKQLGSQQAQQLVQANKQKTS
jgi:hypothetical protein